MRLVPAMLAWFFSIVCAVSLVAGAASAETVFKRGNDSDPETLDPQKTSTVAEANILRDLFDNLMIHDGEGRVIHGSAESHTVSADGRVYTLKLRANARWSNGEPLKASDFVFTYRRIMDPATGAKYANVLYPILNAERINKGELKTPDALGVKALDEHTVEITLERPTPYFLELLTHQTSAPLNEKSVTALGKDMAQAGKLVSNGAYVLAENVPNDHITLVKNPYFYAADSVKIDKVIYIPLPDLSAAVKRYKAGEVDFLSDLPADQLPTLKREFGDQVKITPYLGTYYLAFNTRKKPFDDPRVRLALSMVIDREFINDEIWQGAMVPAYGFVPPGVGNYGEPAVAEFKEFPQIEREDKAKALLAAAGYGPGKTPLKVEIRYNTTDNNRSTVVAIADEWKVLGVATSLINTDAKTHFAYLRDGGDFDAARAGWIADYSDPQNFLFLLQSDNLGLNYSRYQNPEFDAIMKAADAEPDLKKRAEIMLKADRIIARDQPVAPLLFYASRNLVSPRLKGFTPNLRGANATRFLSLAP